MKNLDNHYFSLVIPSFLVFSKLFLWFPKFSYVLHCLPRSLFRPHLSGSGSVPFKGRVTGTPCLLGQYYNKTNHKLISKNFAAFYSGKSVHFFWSYPPKKSGQQFSHWKATGQLLGSFRWKILYRIWRSGNPLFDPDVPRDQREDHRPANFVLHIHSYV